MRAIGGFAVLLFFGLLGGVFVLALASWKGSDPRLAAGYCLGILAWILVAASVLGVLGSAAVLANPGRQLDQVEILRPENIGRPAFGDSASKADDDSQIEPSTYPPRTRLLPRQPDWESRYSAGIGLLVSFAMGLTALWALNIASNLTERNLFTGKSRSYQAAGGAEAAGHAAQTFSEETKSEPTPRQVPPSQGSQP